MAADNQKENPSGALDDLESDSLPSLDDFDSFSAEVETGETAPSLEQYGVWVKIEPEEISPDEEELGQTELLDLPEQESGEADAPGIGDTLSLPEEDTMEQPGMFAEEPSGLSDSGLDLNMDLDLSDTDRGADPEPDSGTNNADSIDTLEEISTVAQDPNNDITEVSLDDLGITIGDTEADDQARGSGQAKKNSEVYSAPENPAEKSDDDDDFMDFDLDLDLEEEDTVPGAEEPAAMPDMELDSDFTIEEFTPGDTQDVTENETPGPAVDLVSEDLPDFGDAMEDLPEIGGEKRVPTPGDEELPDFGSLDQDMGALGDDDEIEVPLSEKTQLDEGYDDLRTIEQDEPAALPASSGDQSARILMKIEAELLAIKGELTALKKELGTLRGGTAGDLSVSDTSSKPDQAKSFFEHEEEDEKIALTGEELDNILSTADIKEGETLEAPVQDTEDELGLQDDILSYGGGEATPDAAPAADDLSFEIEPVSEETSENQGTFLTQEVSASNEIEIEIPDMETMGADYASEPVESLESAGPMDFDTTASGAEPGFLEGDSSLDISDLPTVEEISLEGPAFEDPLEAVEPLEEAPPAAGRAVKSDGSGTPGGIPDGLKDEIKSVLGYMDQLLEALPEEKIKEFAKSEYFAVYKKLFEELGLVS